MVPHEERDGGAGLIVAAIWQFVVVSVSLAFGTRADAAGQVELFANNVLPDICDGV